MAEAPIDPPEGVEELIRLATTSAFGSRVIAALLRRILELQDDASEDELMNLIAEVERKLAAQDPTPD
jgi:hypothetical protein